MWGVSGQVAAAWGSAAEFCFASAPAAPAEEPWSDDLMATQETESNIRQKSKEMKIYENFLMIMFVTRLIPSE